MAVGLLKLCYAFLSHFNTFCPKHFPVADFYHGYWPQNIFTKTWVP